MMNTGDQQAEHSYDGRKRHRPERYSMLWGWPFSTWDLVIRTSLWIAAVAGAFTAAFGFIAGYVGYALSDAIQVASDQRIAQLNLETEKLRKENLEVATIAEPREFPLFGVTGGPDDNAKAIESLNAELKAFSGTKITLVFVPEYEPQTLASQLAELLGRFSGWNVTLLPYGNLSSLRYLKEGVSIYTRSRIGLDPHTGKAVPAKLDGPAVRVIDAAEILRARLQAQLGKNFFSVNMDPILGTEFSPTSSKQPDGTRRETLANDVMLVTIGPKPVAALISEMVAKRAPPPK